MLATIPVCCVGRQYVAQATKIRFFRNEHVRAQPNVGKWEPFYVSQKTHPIATPERNGSNSQPNIYTKHLYIHNKCKYRCKSKQTKSPLYKPQLLTLKKITNLVILKPAAYKRI